MGDTAERKFEELWGEPFVRFGINRPPFSIVGVPARIRHIPDYLTENALIECVGYGRDGILKLKIEKHNCLLFWNNVCPVELFVWNSKRKKHAVHPISVVHEWLSTGEVNVGVFSDNNPYFAIPDALVFP